MFRSDKLAAVAALTALALSGWSASAADEKKEPAKSEEGWVQLFNGKDIEGWKISYGGKGNKDNSSWKVVDGILVSDGEVSHLFSPRGDYENFHFRIEAMISDKGNSGQYFRTAFGPGFPKGYEAQINATHGDPVKTGSLYNFVKVLKCPHKPDEWFTQEVIADGNHIIIKVNGETTVDFIDKKNTFTKGHFAFQQHNIGSVVKIRKAEVKELPPTKKE